MAKSLSVLLPVLKVKMNNYGTYVVTMKLKKDLPNWVSMYGRKISLDYRGSKDSATLVTDPTSRNMIFGDTYGHPYTPFT